MQQTEKRLFFVLLAIAGLKLFLVSNMAVVASGRAVHDDMLFINLASNILQGQWLGHYNHFTLIKGVFYPLFIALNFTLGLPLLLTQQILFIFAGMLFIYIVSRFTKNSVILAMVFIFYTFLPLLSQTAFCRVIRGGVYVSEVVFLFSSLFGLILYRNYNWALFTGLSLSMLWFTREEGIWVVPSVVAAYLIILFKVENNGRYNFFKKLPVLGVPVVMLFLFYTLICYVNWINYGLFVVNELNHKSFLKAYGALTRVKSVTWLPQVPVQFSTMDEIAKKSQTFSEIEKAIEVYWPRRNGELGGGMFLWTLRDAVAHNGYCKSGASAMVFYERLADGINGLCSRGALNCGPIRNTLTPKLNGVYINGLPKTFLRLAMASVAFLPALNDVYSSGEEVSIALFQTITGNRIYPSQLRAQARCTGWAYKEGAPPLQIKLKSVSTDNPCPPQVFKLSRDRADDVVAGQKAPSAVWSRFSFELRYNPRCSVGFYDNSSALVGEIPIEWFPNDIHKYDRSFTIYIDKAAAGTDYGDSDPITDYIPSLKLEIINSITDKYNGVFAYLCIAALLCYLANLFIFRKYTTLFYINTVVMVGIISRLSLISLMHVTSFSAFVVEYISPVTVLACLFIPLSIIDTFSNINSRKAADPGATGQKAA
ncbi:MAG: hypothetical protein L7F77_08855 [Candidatus Magnetominusculus sp. LBB02]|nr:hypothetical protein [Candidatus Magnetominusculus sp. LBB02]